MNLARLSKKAPHNDGRMTLTQLHESKLNEFERMEALLPQKEHQLDQLRRKLNQKKFQGDKDLIGKINKLEGEIERLKNKTDMCEYLQKAAKYIKEYCDQSKKYRNIEENKKKKDTSQFLVELNKSTNKGSICKKYMEECCNVAFTKPQKIVDIDSLLCNECGVVREIISAEAIAVCPSCGRTKPYQDRTQFHEFSEEVEITSPFAYKRVNHLREWLAQMQAKESTIPPQEVIDALLIELKKNRIQDPNLITRDRIKGYLKKLRLQKQYEHIPSIINKICGLPPPVITQELENKLIGMFEEIQLPFEKHCPPDRSNFLSYSYTLYKMCELLGEKHLLSNFSLLKSREKLYIQDKIWEGICKELNWNFIPSL